MVQPAEQLDESPKNLYERLVTALEQAELSHQGKLDLPAIELDSGSNPTLDEVRVKVEAMMRGKKNSM